MSDKLDRKAARERCERATDVEAALSRLVANAFGGREHRAARREHRAALDELDEKEAEIARLRERIQREEGERTKSLSKEELDEELRAEGIEPEEIVPRMWASVAEKLGARVHQQRGLIDRCKAMLRRLPSSGHPVHPGRPMLRVYMPPDLLPALHELLRELEGDDEE